MNRLTHKSNVEGVYNPNSIEYFDGDITDKLGKIEDVLEKYGIESVEELDNLLTNYRTSPILTEEMIKEIAVKEQRRVMKDLVKEICYQEYGDIFKDRDTWKKACELACNRLAWHYDYLIDGISSERIYSKDYPNHFYQQAQKDINIED